MSARAQPLRLRSVAVAAPIGGDDTVSPGSQIPESRSIFSWNLIGAEYGLRSRLGWREWATGLDGPVLSILPFNGSTAAANRLFACTASGIWDVSSSTIAPERVVTFPTQNVDSGYGQSTVMVTLAGHFLVYTDEANGLYVYSETGATWTAGGLPATPVTGVDPARLVGVVPWKNRLWFVERESARGWYLDIGAATGAATAFNFGARFTRGGELRCLASWTGDGGVGSGLDDRLVAISSGGDVVVYEGTDPALAGSFSLKGVWYAGAVPAGRRLTTDNGGELLYMTSTGIASLATLVSGNSALDRRQYQTFQVANLFNQLQASTSNLRGWAMRLHPQDGALMVLVPTGPNQPTQQLAMSLTTKGWHRYRDLPMGICAEPWGGSLYFGTQDGRVCINDGYLDGVTLADPNSYSPVNWSLLTAFSNLGRATRKRVQQIIVQVLSQGGSIPLTAEARYDFDLSEAALPIAAQSGAGVAKWDSAIWDESKWAGSYQVQREKFGAIGNGVQVALAIRGAASSRMTLVGADVLYDEGGFR